MGILEVWRRRGSNTAPRFRVGLRPSDVVLEQYRREGADEAAAIRGAKRQLEGLHAEIDDDARWARLVRLARDIGDPWNADEWPLGFDGLLCAISLCTHVSFECARCPVGRRQAGMSCAHPTTAFGRIGGLVRAGDREGLRLHLRAIETMLDEVDP